MDEIHYGNTQMALTLPLPGAIINSIDNKILAIVLGGGLAFMLMAIIFGVARTRSERAAKIDTALASLFMVSFYLLIHFHPPFSEVGIIAIFGVAGTSFYLSANGFET